MKGIDLKCDRCGAEMQLNEEKTMAKCPYCKNKTLIKKEDDINTLKKHAAELGYVKEAGKQRAIDEAESKRNKNKFKKTIKIILIIVCVIVVSFLVTHLSKEKVDDPFSCVNIGFSGIDGQGKINIVDNESCDYYSDIDFVVSKKEGIKEGEKITVTAVSDIYRFDVTSKEFKVEGLSLFLNDLNDLSDDVIKSIHEFSEDEINNGSLGITFRGTVVNLVPYKFYLESNNKDSNVLYDVYKISIKTNSGKVFDKFVVAYYEDFILTNNKTDFSYKKLYHCGNIIKAGDPNVYTANSKDYVGNISGFLTEAEFKAYLKSSNDGSYVVTER